MGDGGTDIALWVEFSTYVPGKLKNDPSPMQCLFVKAAPWPGQIRTEFDPTVWPTVSTPHLHHCVTPASLLASPRDVKAAILVTIGGIAPQKCAEKGQVKSCIFLQLFQASHPLAPQVLWTRLLQIPSMVLMVRASPLHSMSSLDRLHSSSLMITPGAWFLVPPEMQCPIASNHQSLDHL